MKDTFAILACLLTFCGLSNNLWAKAETSAVVDRATEIRILPAHHSSGLIHDPERIVFTASAQVTVQVITPDNDPKNRSYISGKKATAFKIVAENCLFVLKKPEYGGRDNRDDHMQKVWQKTLAAIESLKQGKPITLMFHQPEIDIRQSVVTRISGIGSAYTR
ncbi:hypothetical protein N8766_01550 [bacterium]|jgi:hypothetical protein|nr:hypothetical protein [bacterium]MDA7667634.1 hypothetical protein [bacterium]